MRNARGRFFQNDIPGVGGQRFVRRADRPAEGDVLTPVDGMKRGTDSGGGSEREMIVSAGSRVREKDDFACDLSLFQHFIGLRCFAERELCGDDGVDGARLQKAK